MGICGLVTLITEANQDRLLQKVLLKNQYLIIDGNNICMCLYESKFNDFFGGEYDQFYEYVVLKFFKTLLKYDIRPVVLFDYSTDKPERNILSKYIK